jgi:uncharacterized protein YggT (Ycf19 family)
MLSLLQPAHSSLGNQDRPMDAFGIINFILAMAMYTLMGRFILSLFFDQTNTMVLWKVFQQVTDPIVGAVRFVTPEIVPLRIVILFAALWMLALRIGLFLVMRYTGAVPSVPL